MTEDVWGPWIGHDGKGCPCVGQFVQAEMCAPNGRLFKNGRSVVYRSGFAGGALENWDWSKCGQETKKGKIACRIVFYRIRKPRALSQLQDLIADLPQEVDA